MVIFQHWNFSIIGTFPKLEFFQLWNFSIVGNFPILEFFQHLIFTVLKAAIPCEHSTLCLKYEFSAENVSSLFPDSSLNKLH